MLPIELTVKMVPFCVTLFQAESKLDYTGPRLGEEPADPLNMATQRRAGMPVGQPFLELF